MIDIIIVCGLILGFLISKVIYSISLKINSKKEIIIK